MDAMSTLAKATDEADAAPLPLLSAAGAVIECGRKLPCPARHHEKSWPAESPTRRMEERPVALVVPGGGVSRFVEEDDDELAAAELPDKDAGAADVTTCRMEVIVEVTGVAA